MEINFVYIYIYIYVLNSFDLLILKLFFKKKIIF
jgi:hypothetical protein